MSFRLLSVLAALSSALIAASPPVSAATYDLTTDWSTGNPNGPWSYVAGNTVLPSQSNWGGYGPAFASSSTGGNPTNHGWVPMIMNYNGSDPTDFDAVAGNIVAHSQSNDANSGAGNFAVLFTTPVAGTATISGEVWNAHASVDRWQAWSVLVNNVVEASGVVKNNTYANGGSAHPELFNLPSLTLSAGDIIALDIVMISGGAQTNGGLVGLDMSVDLTAATPLPAALPLFAGGLGALGLLGWRRKRKAEVAAA